MHFLFLSHAVYELHNQNTCDNCFHPLPHGLTTISHCKMYKKQNMTFPFKLWDLTLACCMCVCGYHHIILSCIMFKVFQSSFLLSFLVLLFYHLLQMSSEEWNLIANRYHTVPVKFGSVLQAYLVQKINQDNRIVGSERRMKEGKKIDNMMLTNFVFKERYSAPNIKADDRWNLRVLTPY